jgi:hypothetical protein
LAAKLFESHGTWTPAFAGSAVMALTSAALALGLWRATGARPSGRAAGPAAAAAETATGPAAVTTRSSTQS